MDARELRMGNLILRDNEEMVIYHLEKRYKNVWRVNSLDIDFDDQIQIDKLCSPIFLTEDWLVKFGFIWVDIILKGWKLKPIVVYPAIGLSEQKVVFQGAKIECQYVHSLQNLYFALTGKELEIKNA